ncbi:MAG: hypothetical protein HQM16_06680 [Deltaproteobacteria bacterium]|nr:hypothetical protein [Deltaproteobacteria bacterium]
MTLSSLKYDKAAKLIYYKTKKNKELVFKANDFIASVVQHISFDFAQDCSRTDTRTCGDLY